MAKPGLALRCMNARDAFGAVWRQIEREADVDFFLGGDWMDAWLSAAGNALDMYSVWSEDLPIAAAVVSRPLPRLFGLLGQEYRLNETGHEPTDALFMEYNGILARKGYERSALEQVIAQLRKYKLVGVGRILPQHLWVRAASPAFTTLICERFPSVRVVKQEPSPFVDFRRLRVTGKRHADALSANTRQQLNRARRNLQSRGPISIERASTIDRAMQFVGEMKPLHISRWRKKQKTSAFDNPIFELFLRKLVANGIPSQTVDVLRFTVGADAFGFLFNFRYRGKVLNYTSGFDYDRFSEFKPGMLSHLLAIEQAEESGAISYNFLAGASRYKTSLSTDSEYLSWLKLRL